jgi:hypothetical protein
MGNIRKKISHIFTSFLTLISPKLNTKFLYWKRFGKKLDFNNPQTSNEKVLWLKFNTYYKNPLVIQCADKYAVREYVEKCGCGEILNDLYGVYDNVKDIDFDKFPNKFVMKLNYGCGMNLICQDKSKLNISKTKRMLAKWMRSLQHLRLSEMHYSYIPKKIICEKFLDTHNNAAPDDYKIYCCNGKPYYVMVCIGRDKGRPKFYYFDCEGNLQREMTRDGLQAPEDFHYDIPAGWNEMIRYAEILSAPFPFVRSDFYLVDGKVVFGELTFTPAAGLDTGKLEYTDRLLGDLINLSK